MSKRCLRCMEVYRDEFAICPHCGYIEGMKAEEATHMKPGTLLYSRYTIGKVLGFGGFGVTYIGWDGKLEQKVAIKEYLPSEFSTRMPGQSTVTIFNGEKSEQFHDGMNKFVDEAKRLAKFQNEPGIVKVFDSFLENETAYIVMEFLDGETLAERLKRDKTIPEDEAIQLLWPIMNSLQTIHQEGILHRDIAPDNIFLTKSGDIKLIDFGASRYATTSHSRSLTVIIKPGYSPEEQYRSRGDQGPHTDVYAIAATLYKMITGKTPPDAMERRAKVETQKKEILEEPHKLNKKISLNRENAILNAMNVRIEDRTSDMLTFMNELNANPPAKRRYGKIKKIDLYSWPLWLKIAMPTLLALVVVFGVMLVTGIIKFPSLFSDTIKIPNGIVIVPDVEGLNKDEALKLIRENNLIPTPDGNVISEYVTAGKIVLQSPIGGNYLEEYSMVVLTVSSGQGVVEVQDGIATVPYVIWDTQENAIAKLLQAGLTEPIIKTKNDANIPAGQVISQSVESGTQVDEGTQITLVVSTGPEAFEMPNVVEQPVSIADNILKSRGLIISVEYRQDSSTTAGTVISQSIAPGKFVQSGDRVTLIVASNKQIINVIDVVGLIHSEALSNLKEQGFNVRILENYDNNVTAGFVIRQSPIAGSPLEYGEDVVIYVSKGTANAIDHPSDTIEEKTLVNVIGDTEDNAKNKIHAQGLKVAIKKEYSETVAVGNVIRQAPAAGTSLYAAEIVTIYISLGKKPISPLSITLNKETDSLYVGETIQLSAIISPNDATYSSITWYSSNSTIATVSNSGYLTAISTGSAVISVELKYNGQTLSDSFQITVKTVGAVELNDGYNINLALGSTGSVWCFVDGFQHWDNITWSVSDPSVVSLSPTDLTNPMTIKAVGEGTSQVIATVVIGGRKYSGSCTVIVKNSSLKIQNFKITPYKGGYHISGNIMSDNNLHHYMFSDGTIFPEKLISGKSYFLDVDVNYKQYGIDALYTSGIERKLTLYVSDDSGKQISEEIPFIVMK